MSCARASTSSLSAGGRSTFDEPIEATEARIRIAGIDLRREVDKEATKTVFKARLPSGRTRLETWFTLPDGNTRGAYFVYVRRVGS